MKEEFHDMKTIEEIKEKIIILQIVEDEFYANGAPELADHVEGEIEALKWVLEQ